MAFRARVLSLTADNDLSLALANGLDCLGWPSLWAQHDDAALAAVADLEIEAVLVDTRFQSDQFATFPGLIAALRAACAPRMLPVIGLLHPDVSIDRQIWDMTLAFDAHPNQMALRLEHLVRAAVAEEEFKLRAETLADFGVTLTDPGSADQDLAVLSVGAPEPSFLALSNAMTRMGISVTAAFSSYSAFDYLHEKSFDSVVLWGGGNPAEALSIASGMRRNTRLYHVPILMNLRGEDGFDPAEAFHRGISDLATPGTPEDESAQRVQVLARAYRRQGAIRTALESVRQCGKVDAGTGLFTRDMFAVHLSRLSTAAQARNRPLSLCVLKITDLPEVVRARARGWLDRAMPQIGSMIGRLVRAEDTAARLSGDVFALALPATTVEAARQVGERIAAVVGCTAFESGDGLPPFVVEFDVGYAQVLPGESAAAALERAALELTPRPEPTHAEAG